MFDCIIVGAGAAGGTAAYHLAKQGKSILVLEKESLPRYKPCNGGISPALAQWFDFDLTPALSQKITKARLTWKMGDAVEIELSPSDSISVVQRDVFDHFLIQQAQKQGATLQDKTEVIGVEFKGEHWQVNTNNGETFSARYLIAADGANGSMSKMLGLQEPKRRMAVALEVETSVTDNSTVHFEFGSLKNGYIWKFPQTNGYSLGITYFVGKEPKDLKKILTDYATQSGLELSQSQLYEYSLCLWEGDRKLHTENALLAGENAGIVDPFTAEGLRPSIFSGLKAAEAINQALDGSSDALEKYTQIIKEEWGVDMAWAQRLAGLFYRVPGIAYKVGVNLPGATSRMVQILCGEIRYSQVAERAIKRLSSKLIPGMG